MVIDFQGARTSLFLRRALLLIGATVLVVSGAHAELVRQANTTLTLPAELPAATGYTTSNALGDLTFNVPMSTTFPNGETNRLYVVEREGIVKVVNDLGTTPIQAVFMDLATYLTSQGSTLMLDSDNGLMAMAFHPNYQENGYFYLYYSISRGGKLYQRLARFQATGTAGNYRAATSADPATETPLLTILDDFGNHNGCDIIFGVDGYLYISLGDEGRGTDEYDNARYINKNFWGHMLRLDVDNNPANLAPNASAQASTEFPSAIHPGMYRVPADNPFIGYTEWHGIAITPETVRTEIFATGLRSPFRFNIDHASGRIFLGDVGENTYEEINEIVKGGDYGWSWREGFHDFEGEPWPWEPPPGYENFRKDPIFEYDHTDDGVGNDAVIFGVAVCGGMIYRGHQLPELHGKLIFSEIFAGGGIIAALTETSPGVWTAERIALREQIVDFGTDPRNGEALLCSLQGTVYRLERSGTSGTAPPATLSATGAFSDLATLTPHEGIVPYTPNVDFWSDHAKKSRWFSIKNTTDTMTWNATGHWTFPTGMVWIKHFDFETERGNPATRRKLETRFLVKTDEGMYGLSYRWRADQTDADLVAEEGLTEAIPSSSPAQTWRYPSRAECMTCHTLVAGHALSFNNPQLNRDYVHGGTSQNQIEALSQAGYFSAAATGVENLPAFARADDEAQSLEWRVRSYLSVNCSQCHQPGGASQGLWDARHTTPLGSANLINGPLVYHAGDSANRFMVPGDPAHSMLLKRQRGDGVHRMPPLATSERDLDAEELVTRWINSLGRGTLAFDLPAGATIYAPEGTNAVIPIIRTGGADGEVGFTLTTTDGGATAGLDYITPPPAHTFGDEVTTLSVPISIEPAGIDEANESFTVMLSAPTGGAKLGAVTTVTVQIVDAVDMVNPSAPVITSPVASPTLGQVSGAPFLVSGTAKDNKGVGTVKVKLNQGPFVDAALTSAGTSSTAWNIQVTFTTGPNTLTVQSLDTSDRPSTLVTRSFIVTRPLVVTLDADLGSVTGGYAPSSYREVGKSHTITASPLPPKSATTLDGGLFTGWTVVGATNAQIGIVDSALAKQTLTFIFREGLQLTANFIDNPFTSMAGTYHGLIRPSETLPDRAPAGAGNEDGTARNNSTEGRFTATVQKTGAFSASLMIDGLSLNFSGAFDASGDARFGTARLLTQTVARANKPSLIVALQLDLATPGEFDRITGTVTARDFKQSVLTGVSLVDAERAYYNGTTRMPLDYLGPANASGVFTSILPAEPLVSQTGGLTEGDYPQGTGVATITIARTGAVTITGALADGSTLNATSALTQSNTFPLFAQLYGKLGFLSGWAQLDHTQPASDLAAEDLQWLRPFMSSSHYYPNGWTTPIDLDLRGARYTVVAGQSVLRAVNGAALTAADENGNVALEFTNGRLSEPLEKAANLSTADVVTRVPSNDPTFTLIINRTSGAATGAFDHTDDTRPVYNAIIYQKGPDAGAHGYFLTKQPVPIDYTGESGRVRLNVTP